MRSWTIIIFFLVSCGGDDKAETPDKQFDSEVKPLLARYCKSCHESSAFVSSASAFRSSQAGARIKNKNMPQAGSQAAKDITQAERDQLVGFAESKPAEESSSPY